MVVGVSRTRIVRGIEGRCAQSDVAKLVPGREVRGIGGGLLFNLCDEVERLLRYLNRRMAGGKAAAVLARGLRRRRQDSPAAAPGRAGICRMIRIVTTTPIARRPPKTATNGPNAPMSSANGDSANGDSANGDLAPTALARPATADIDDEADDDSAASALAPSAVDEVDEIDEAVDAELDATAVPAEDATDEELAAGAAPNGAVAARLIAARFSPHSTQKRAPLTTGAPHCGQNFTAYSRICIISSDGRHRSSRTPALCRDDRK